MMLFLPNPLTPTNSLYRNQTQKKSTKKSQLGLAILGENNGNQHSFMPKVSDSFTNRYKEGRKNKTPV